MSGGFDGTLCFQSAPSTTPGATHAKLDSVGSARLKKTGMQDHNVCEKSEMNEMNEKCLYPYLQRCDRETNKHPVPNHTRNDSQPQEEKGKHSMAWWTCRRLFVLVDVQVKDLSLRQQQRVMGTIFLQGWPPSQAIVSACHKSTKPQLKGESIDLPGRHTKLSPVSAFLPPDYLNRRNFLVVQRTSQSRQAKLCNIFTLPLNCAGRSHWILPLRVGMLAYCCFVASVGVAVLSSLSNTLPLFGTETKYQNYHSRSSPHTPNYLAQDMHFSFVLTVVAAFAALATSKSVDACIDKGGICDSTKPAGENCCAGLSCGLGPDSGVNNIIYCH
ncbi:hypothetical protein BD769DRAFT_1387413 [Suillus cothurnatus]|nr:hypothetical protein BD769DRAFT_1387413 [Suillus cothurnatus]